MNAFIAGFLLRANGLIRVIAAGMAAAVAAGLCLAGPAQAAGRPPAAAIGPPPATGQAPAAAAAKKCFYTIPDCASSNPDVSFTITSIGDTSGCTFKTTVDWGDGKSGTASYPGGSDGSTLETFKHSYAKRAAVFDITVTSTTTAGSCGAANGPLQFTLTGCANAFSANASAARNVTADHSPNWAGYVAGTLEGCFTNVTGQWVQPKITCPKTNQGSKEVDFWVGLDGGSQIDQTVEQTGVEVRCDWNSSAKRYATHYRAWYEMFPLDPVYDQGGFGTLNPRPGSTVKATVSYNSKAKTYRLELTVTAHGKTRTGSVNQACPAGSDCKNVTAEWIAEKVTLGLAAFAPWTLTGGRASTTKAGDQTVAALRATPQDLVPGKKILAYTCGLNGSRFLVRQSRC
jgi:hypothetical protein